MLTSRQNNSSELGEVTIFTGRKRIPPTLSCVPAIARLTACRWGHNRAPDGEILVRFEGRKSAASLAAQIHERVVARLETERQALRQSPAYRHHYPDGRAQMTKEHLQRQAALLAQCLERQAATNRSEVA